MPSKGHSIRPHTSSRPTSIRKAYIQNLTELLHVCLLRGELDRATRAWSILIRCREVDWKSRWNWGLLILNHTTRSAGEGSEATSGRDVEKWLKGLRLSAPEAEKPALLHALILHQIKHGQYRSALGELETYLPSYPYMLSGPLHTYAGLLNFYLAQAEALRPSRGTNEEPFDASMDETSSQPDAALLRAARGWFVKAQGVDVNDQVAGEFIQLIDHPESSNFGTEDDGSKDDDEDDGKSTSTDSRPWNEVPDESP